MFTATLGLLVGGAVVGGVLYYQAKIDVLALLALPVWEKTGRVFSAPMEIWPGMQLTPGELAADLQASGYARVRTVSQPGDFQVSSDSILLHVPEAAGARWRTAEAEVLFTFKDGQISSVTPDGRARLAPMELAALRGPEGEARRPISLDELPAHVYQAILAIEDARFFEHEGVDPVGIGRAVVANLTAGGISQGGSTLTQQLVKNLFLSSERSYQRKAREALLAVALENLRTKRDILEMYLNEIYLGQVGGAGVAGIDQAARAYFGKTAERLELAEAAVLAGIISAPNRYSPLRHPERAIERRNMVLGRMATLGWITAEQHEQTRSLALQLVPTSMSWRSPWMVEAAIERVEAAVGQEGAVSGQGWEVHTTLQPALQRIAEAAVATSMARLDADYPQAAGAQVALVAVRASDGAVLAMVGGRSHAESAFNRVTSAYRQIGSTIKPLTYLAAIETDSSRSPGTPVDDTPFERTVSGVLWSPSNYDGRYKGTISYRAALRQSRNIPAVRVAEAVGMEDLARRWRALGLSRATALPSAALGSIEASPLELAGAYTVFPGEGVVALPRLVQSAVDAAGSEVYTERPVLSRAASAQATWLVSSMLKDVVDAGTGRAARRFGVTGPVGGKTGTTDEEHDAWFAGFTDGVVVVAWVGFDRGKDLGLTGGKGALPTWSRFVAASGLPQRIPEPPTGLTRVRLCSDSLQPSECSTCTDTYEEWFVAGAEPTCALGSPLREAISRMIDGLGGDESGDPARRGLLRRRQ